MRRATSEQIGTAQAVLAELATDLQARLTRARAAGRLSAAASTAVELADVLSVAASLGGWHEQGERLEPDGRGSGGAVGERPQLRALGPVDLDVADVPELREVGRTAGSPALLDATPYLAELEAVRAVVLGETPEVDRWRVRAARLNASGRRGSEAHQALVEAVTEHGWQAVQDLLRWGWREVAAGRRPPKLQACVLTPGGIGALLEAHGRAQQAERDRLAAEEAERQRALRDAEERRALGVPASEYAAGLLAELASAGVVGESEGRR